MSRKPKLITAHTNSEGEVLEIREIIADISARGLKGAPLLVMVDDAPPKGTGKSAPMLLDFGTRNFLKRVIAVYDQREEQENDNEG